MGVSESQSGRLRRVAGMAAGLSLVIVLLAIFYLNLFSGTALAGSETGEFCPDCPDWSNFEGWLAKRAAYDQQQDNNAQSGNVQVNGIPVQAAGSNPSQNTVAPQQKSYPVPQLLTSAAASREGMAILDVRTPEDYKSGHIPGARNIYWKELQTQGRLDPSQAVEALRRAGVNDTDRLLICGGSDEGVFITFWALCCLGHQKVSLLDGGAKAAWDAGVKPETEVPIVPESNYTAHIVPWLLVNESNLNSFLNLSDIQILDARDFVDYGKSKFTNASIPLTADKLYEETRIKDAAALEDLLGGRGLDKEGTQLVYGTPQAYQLFFALRLMGYNATLLEGDWWQQTKLAVKNIR
jgi:thiosulfate/3-mercaptopyruvate sulfurtransferase